MKLRVPTMEFVPLGTDYASRTGSLKGLRVGFLDGWGDQNEVAVGMYPAMAEIERVLVQEYGAGEIVWQMKPSISHAVPFEMLREFAERVDVVVNGEGL